MISFLYSQILNTICMNYLSFAVIFLVLFASSQAFSLSAEYSDCRFAKNYRTADLIRDPIQLSSFLRNFVKWEANFIHQIGVDEATGFTFDGIRVDVNTG